MWKGIDIAHKIHASLRITYLKIQTYTHDEEKIGALMKGTKVEPTISHAESFFAGLSFYA